MSQQPGAIPPEALETGDPVEEIIEFVMSGFETDEYRAQRLVNEAQMLALLQDSISILREIEEATGEIRVTPEDFVGILNEEWVNTELDLEPDVNTVTFDGDLQPGDEEVVARIVEQTGNYPVFLRATGVTAHKEDLDGDGKNESVVRYHYEYKNRPAGSWIGMDGPSGVQPLGDMVNPSPLIAGGWVGPVSAFQIRFENRTDEGTLADTTIPEDELGGRIDARVTGGE